MLNKIKQSYNGTILNKLKKLCRQKGFKIIYYYDQQCLILEDTGLVIIANEHGFKCYNKKQIKKIDFCFYANSLNILLIKLIRFNLIDEYIINRLLK